MNPSNRPALGSVVQLDTGQVAVVVDVHVRTGREPIVRLLGSDEAGGQEIDLAIHPDIRIARVLDSPTVLSPLPMPTATSA